CADAAKLRARSTGTAAMTANFLSTLDIMSSPRLTRAAPARPVRIVRMVPESNLFLRFAGLVDVAHARVDRLAGLQLLAPHLEQLVPQLVLAAVRKNEPVVGLVFPFDRDGRRVVDRVDDRRLIRQDLRAVRVLVEREALLDRRLLAVRVRGLILRVQQVRGPDDEHVALPAALRVARAARDPLLGRELALADIDAARLVPDLEDDRELIRLLDELDRVGPRQGHHRRHAVARAVRGRIQPLRAGELTVLLDAALSLLGERQARPRPSEAGGPPLLGPGVGRPDAGEVRGSRLLRRCRARARDDCGDSRKKVPDRW